MKPLAFLFMLVLLFAPRASAQTLTMLPMKERSADSDMSFVAFNNGVLIRTARARLNEHVRYFLLRTTDDGHTWINIDSTNWLNLVEVVKGHGNIYARDVNEELWSSTDEGVTWDTMPKPSDYNLTTDGRLEFVTDQRNAVVFRSARKLWIVYPTPGMYSQQIPISLFEGTVDVVNNGMIVVGNPYSNTYYYLDSTQKWQSLRTYIESIGLLGYRMYVASDRLLLFDTLSNTYELHNDTVVLLKNARAKNDMWYFSYVDDDIMFADGNYFFVRSAPDRVFAVHEAIPVGMPSESVTNVAHAGSAHYWNFGSHVYKLISTEPVLLREAWYTMPPEWGMSPSNYDVRATPNGTLVSGLKPFNSLCGTSADGGVSWHAIEYGAAASGATDINMDTQGTVYFNNGQCITSTDNCNTFSEYEGELCNLRLSDMVFHSDGTVSYSWRNHHYRAPTIGAPFAEIDRLSGHDWTLFNNGDAVYIDSNEFAGKYVVRTGDDGTTRQTVGGLPPMRDGASPSHTTIRLNDNELAIIRATRLIGDTSDVWHYNLTTHDLKVVYTGPVIVLDVLHPPGHPLLIATGAMSVIAIEDNGTATEFVDPFFGRLTHPEFTVGSYTFHHAGGTTYLISSDNKRIFRLSEFQNVTGIDDKGAGAHNSRRAVRNKSFENRGNVICVQRNELFNVETFVHMSPLDLTATITNLSGQSYVANLGISGASLHVQAPSQSGMYFVTLHNDFDIIRVIIVVL